MSSNNENRLTFFARTNYHDERRTFGIRQADRHAHMYIIGKTGSGKSTLLETLVAQDIKIGHGLMLLDPHGDMVERIAALSYLPSEEVTLFDHACSRHFAAFGS